LPAVAPTIRKTEIQSPNHTAAGTCGRTSGVCNSGPTPLTSKSPKTRSSRERLGFNRPKITGKKRRLGKNSQRESSSLVCSSERGKGRIYIGEPAPAGRIQIQTELQLLRLPGAQSGRQLPPPHAQVPSHPFSPFFSSPATLAASCLLRLRSHGLGQTTSSSPYQLQDSAQKSSSTLKISEIYATVRPLLEEYPHCC
jgi:hypothetical protein